MQQFKKTGLPVVIQPADVERRVERALKTMWSLPDKDRARLAKQTQWPFATIDDRGDLNSQAENSEYLAEIAAEQRNRFQPTPADLQDMNTALAWFNHIRLEEKTRMQLIRKGRIPLSPEQWLIWWRTRGLSFAAIAKRNSTSDETARRHTAAAWNAIWQVANAAEYARIIAARRAGLDK